MLKKLLCLALAGILSIGMSTSVFAADGHVKKERSFDEAVPIEIQIAMAAQEDALNSYFKLTEYFEKDEFGAPIYPKEYAGEYIDDNNKLVVQITKKFNDERILAFLKSDKNITVKNVKYSYQDLIAYKSTANALYKSEIKVTSDGVDIKKNKYKISVQKEDLNKASLKYSKSTNTESPIVFEEGEQAIATSLWGGDRIFNEHNNEFMTIGISGTYNGSKAILTCGHSNEKFGISSPSYPYIKNIYNRIGQVVYQQANTGTLNYGVNSLGDFAIVNISSSDTISNYVQPGVQITGTYSSVPVGTTIYKYGTTTGYSWGNVTGINIRATYSGSPGTLYVVGGLYSMSMQNDSGTAAISPGDSGGPVWRKSGSSNLIHGIVTAKIEGTNIMFSTPIYYAQNKGFTPKTN